MLHFLKGILIALHIISAPVSPTISSNLQVNSSTTIVDQTKVNKTTIQPTYNDLCRKYAQIDADSSGKGSESVAPVHYSLISSHYSVSDDSCYFELHYQMNINYRGQTIISQVYQLYGIPISEMNFDIRYNNNNSAEEAECNIPETIYVGAINDCKYHGLTTTTNNYGQTFVIAKYGFNDSPPMSYQDYKDLLEKRMTN